MWGYKNLFSVSEFNSLPFSALKSGIETLTIRPKFTQIIYSLLTAPLFFVRMRVTEYLARLNICSDEDCRRVAFKPAEEVNLSGAFYSC